MSFFGNINFARTSINRIFATFFSSDQGGNGINASTGAARFLGLISDNTTTTIETNADDPMPSGGTLTNMKIAVSTNTCSFAVICKSRVNAADGNMTFSITASTTGDFEDTTNNDVVITNDLVNIETSGTGGTGDVKAGLVTVTLTP